MLSLSNVGSGAAAASYYETADDYYTGDRSPSVCGVARPRRSGWQGRWSASCSPSYWTAGCPAASSCITRRRGAAAEPMPPSARRSRSPCRPWWVGTCA